jgi:hypothetical protein
MGNPILNDVNRTLIQVLHYCQRPSPRVTPLVPVRISSPAADSPFVTVTSTSHAVETITITLIPVSTSIATASSPSDVPSQSQQLQSPRDSHKSSPPSSILSALTADQSTHSINWHNNTKYRKADNRCNTKPSKSTNITCFHKYALLCREALCFGLASCDGHVSMRRDTIRNERHEQRGIHGKFSLVAEGREMCFLEPKVGDTWRK